MSDDRFDDIEDFFADLDAKQDSESGVVQISDHFEDDVNIIEEDGDLKLRMRNPEGSENDWKKFNISFLRDVPRMQEVLKLGLLDYASSNGQLSVKATVSGLRTGWVAFLLENKMSDLAISKVSGTILTSFALFVRAKYSNNGSRRHLYSWA